MPTTSTTEAARPPRRGWRAPGPGPVGGVLCALGLVALVLPARFAPALGAEALAAGFWWWARADEPARQVPRWRWLRRPATALWLAAAIETTIGAHLAPPATLTFFARVEAIAVVWAALELLAVLPLARPSSDLPGPLAREGSWLPALLPAAGFALLWRHAAVWLDVDEVREGAAALLVATAALAALRAYGRRRWTAALRWMVVCDGALAGVLLASRALDRWSAAALWAAACGTHAILLANESSGATLRRGAAPAALWRAAAWLTTAAVAWPLLTAVASPADRPALLRWAAAAATVVLASWVNVARLLEAPERRAFPRPGSGPPLARLLPVPLLAGVPLALVAAWWVGFAPTPLATWLGAAPALLGGALALLALGRARERADAGARAQHGARRLFRLTIAIERGLVGAAAGLGRALAAPLRDLHTGDAQEYVLLLVGVAVLAVLLPLLR
jgi:hypothetical protein